MTWVAEGIYAAGGEHIPHTWQAFSQQTGIRAVLHLSPSRPQSFIGSNPQTFLWLDLADESQADLEARTLVAEFIRRCREERQAVLLHSAEGRHRVRWAYVAYQLGLGRKLSTVLREAAEKPWLAPYHTDHEMWQAFHAVVEGRKSDHPPRGE